MFLGLLRGFAVFGGIFAIIGVLPAVIGGAAKMKGRDDISYCLGCLSLWSTFICGFAGTGVVTAQLLILGAIISTYCSEVEAVLKEYDSALDATCDITCKAALVHQKDAFCMVGDGMTTTSLFLFVTICLAFTTLVMTCIGFCSKKDEMPAQQQQQQQPQMQMQTQRMQQPVQVTGVVIQATPVQAVQMQAIPVPKV